LLDSDSRHHIGGGLNRSTLAFLAVLSVLMIAIAAGLDAAKALGGWPITANVVAGVLSLPLIAIVTFLVVGRTLRAEEERRLAQKLYFAGRQIDIRTRGLRLAMYRAYLGVDSVKENVLDVTLGREWDELARLLGQVTTALEGQVSLAAVDSSFITEIRIRGEALVQQTLTFMEVLGDMPQGPIRSLAIASKVDRLRYHLAHYGVIVSKDDAMPVQPMQRKREMDELAGLLAVAVEIRNEVMGTVQVLSMKFNYAYFLEDELVEKDAVRDLRETFMAEVYKLEDEQRRQSSGLNQS
jgi:hypothetical protein